MFNDAVRIEPLWPFNASVGRASKTITKSIGRCLVIYGLLHVAHSRENVKYKHYTNVVAAIV